MKLLFKITKFLFILLLSVSIIYILLFTSSKNRLVMKNLEQIISTKLTNATKFNIKLEGINFIYPLTLRVDKIIISEYNSNELLFVGDGINCAIKPSISILFFEKIDITNLSIQKFQFKNSPNLQGKLSILGSYNIHNQSLNLSKIYLTSPILEIYGQLSHKFATKETEAILHYNSSIFKELLGNKKLSSLFGMIGISGNGNQFKINHSGDLLFQIFDNQYISIPNIGLLANLKLLPDGVKGDLHIKQKEEELKSDFAMQDNQFHLNNFIINSSFLSNKTSLLLDTKTLLFEGSSKLNIGNLEYLTQYLPIPTITGSGALDVKFSVNKNKQIISIQTIINDLIASDIKVNKIAMDLNILDFKNYNLAKSYIHLERIESQDLLIPDIEVNLENSRDLIFTMQMNRPYVAKINSKGKLNSSNKFIGITIANLSGTVNQLTLKNQNPIEVFWSQEAFNIEINKTIIGDGSVNFKYNINNKNEISSNLDINNLPLKLWPLSLASKLSEAIVSVKSKVSGTIIKPLINLQIELKNLITRTNSNKSILSVDANLSHDQLNMDGKIYNQSNQLGKFRLDLPINFSLRPFTFLVNDHKNVTGQFVLEESLDLIGLIPMPYGHELYANMTGEATISRTLSKPLVKGNFVIKDGAYFFKEHGIKIQNFSGNIKLHNDKITISDFTGYDIYKNKLLANGIINISNQISFILNVLTDKFNLINSANLRGEINGNLRLEGNEESAKVIGKINFGPYEIKIPEQFAYQIPELNIIKVVDSNQDVNKNNSTNAAYNFLLDIMLNATNQVFVRGLGVDTLLKGNLHIKGNALSPYLSGKLESVKGKYQEFGRILSVKEGIIVFDGPFNKPPFLNIIGALTEGMTEIRVILSGNLQKPDIKIESTPAKEQQKALSLLLFGTEDFETISSFQATQLAASIRKLSNNSSSSLDPIAKAREILRVDNINIRERKGKKNKDGNNTKSTAASIGKYLTDKIYLEVEKDRDHTSPLTKVEVKISPKISIEAIKDEEGGGAIGVNWKFDY